MYASEEKSEPEDDEDRHLDQCPERGAEESGVERADQGEREDSDTDSDQRSQDELLHSEVYVS